MRKRTGSKPRLAFVLTALGISVILFIVLLAVKASTEISESVSVGFSQWWIAVFGGLCSKVSFSVSEFLVYIAVIAVLAFIVSWIYFAVKKRWRSALKSFLVFVVIVFVALNVYTLTASFSYMRKSPNLIYGTDEEPDADKIYAVASYFIDDFNELAFEFEKDDNGMFVNPYSLKELGEIISYEYEKLGSDFLFSYTPPLKEVVFSSLMSDFSTCGVFFAPTGEANINCDIPSFDLPVTCAHEIAHAKGAMKERDANLFAYQICLNSDNDFLRLSGYMHCISGLLSAVNFVCGEESYNELNDRLCKEYSVQWSLYYEYWNKYTAFGDIQEFFNDLYLKMSGIKEGVDNYYIKDEVVIDGATDEVVSFSYNDIQKIFLYIYNEKNGIN